MPCRKVYICGYCSEPIYLDLQSNLKDRRLVSSVWDDRHHVRRGDYEYHPSDLEKQWIDVRRRGKICATAKEQEQQVFLPRLDTELTQFLIGTLFFAFLAIDTGCITQDWGPPSNYTFGWREFPAFQRTKLPNLNPFD